MTKEAIMKIIADRCIEDGDCLIWPGAMSDGNCPQVRLKGKTVNLRRANWEATHGRSIPAGLVAARTCECKRCIRHVEPMTVGEVTRRLAAKGVFSGPARAAKIAKGRRLNARVPQETIDQIRASDEPGYILAKRFGVDPSYVSGVRSGRKRKDYSSPFQGLGALSFSNRSAE